MNALEAAGPNREQIEFWNGTISDVWIEAQERLDASIASLTEGVVRAAGVAPGERVPDIGCGCGTTTSAYEKDDGVVLGAGCWIVSARVL